MNMMFNAVEFIHRLEGEGLSRGAAEAIAEGIEERNRATATKGDLVDIATRTDVALVKTDLGSFKTEIEAKLALAKSELQNEIQKAMNRQTAIFGAMLVSVTGAALTIAGLMFGSQ